MTVLLYKFHNELVGGHEHFFSHLVNFLQILWKLLWKCAVLHALGSPVGSLLDLYLLKDCLQCRFAKACGAHSGSPFEGIACQSLSLESL